MAKNNRRKPVAKNTNFNDVLVALISKGQVGTFFLGATVLVIAIRMPPEKAGELLIHIVDKMTLSFSSIAGWVLSFVLAIGWFGHVYMVRRQNAKEMTRISDERDYWQSQVQDIHGSSYDATPR